MGTLYLAAELPDDPLAAAAAFYRSSVPAIEALMAGPDGPEDELVIVFAPASHAHRAWRLAAIESLARKAAPARVNGVVSSGGDALAAAGNFLARAPGVTGQLLELAD